MSMPPFLAFLRRRGWPGMKVAVFCGAGWSAGTGPRAAGAPPRAGAAAGGAFCARAKSDSPAIAANAARVKSVRVIIEIPLADDVRTKERNGKWTVALHRIAP